MQEPYIGSMSLVQLNASAFTRIETIGTAIDTTPPLTYNADDEADGP